MPPGTTSLISVPEFAELKTVSLPPMRSARSRIPCSPKCPVFPLPATTGIDPHPIVSDTQGKVVSRIRARFPIDWAPECVHALRMAS